MKISALALACALFYVLSISLISARPLLIPPPEELAAKATLICNGRVESITQDRTEKDGINPWDSITYFTAKIKVLHAFKGQAPSEIEIKYHLGPMVPNGPIQMDLTKDKRFRFFLKNNANSSCYVGVLDGNYDDGFAVEPLTPQELDDSPYLSKTEAIEIAKKWLHDNHPKLLPLLETTSSSRYSDGKWHISLSGSGYEDIIISGDRMVVER